MSYTPSPLRNINEPWLHALETPSYLRSVLSALAKHEHERDSARSSSRQNSSQPRYSFQPVCSSNSALAGHYSVAEGSKPENQRHNRYLDIKPYDRTRVVLQSTAGHLRYLNASWVRELAGKTWWIAAQAPLPTTSHAFLSVLTQSLTDPPPSLVSPGAFGRRCRVRTVVQLTQNIESGRQKAHTYFPQTVGQSGLIYPEEGCLSGEVPYKVELLESRKVVEAQCLLSVVRVSPYSLKSDSTRQSVVFRHLLYTAWPDHGVPDPEDRASLLTFIRLVQAVNKDTSLYPGEDVHPDPPIMVNCSAGIGRTGSLIAISSILRSFALLHLDVSGDRTTAQTQTLPSPPIGPLPDEIREDLVAQEIDSLREQRPGMVQREEQIMLIYELIMDAVEESPVLDPKH